uniref:flagellin n=1 Tax=Microvirga sp. G4-2 TaxID=3434467 RepID=UPI0040443534
ITPSAFTTDTAAAAGSPGTAHVIELTLDSVDDFKDGNKITFQVGDGSVREFTMEGVQGADLATSQANLVSKFNAWRTANNITDVAASAFTGNDFQLTVAGAALVDAGTTMSATFTPGVIAQSLKSIDDAIAKVTEGSAMLGANKALLETQEEFISVLSDSLTAGVSAFVDADMNEASTRNQALQTQQQLGVQALSMANQNSQMILKLFQ